MIIEEAQISIFVGMESTTIEIYDRKSSTKFVCLKLTPEQLSMALSQLSNTPVESCEVKGLDKLNKKLEISKHEFEIPNYGYDKRHQKESIHAIALSTCPEGWVPDNYYSSQDTFFEKNGKYYARTTLRRWV